MSRIEEALEKAAQLRKTEGSDSAAQTASKIDAALEKTAGSGALKPNRPAAPAPSKPGQREQQLHIDHPLMVTYLDPRSPLSEEFRKMKSTLVNRLGESRKNKSLMVTSSLSGEGKSVTAINLAITLAQEYDHTVLLVDADLRKPSIHKYFHIQASPGLSNCLGDGIDFSDAVVKTGIGRLSVLPAGREVENPSELLGSQRMKNLVKEVATRYPDRFVIFDTPPVLPVAEARTLCDYVEGVVFVVKEGAVSHTNVNDALAAINRQKVLGIVYNQIHSENLKGRYHYYYHGY